MAISSIFHSWALMPFHFWSVVFFFFGSIVGSFLNVCIHRMPLGQSIVSPPSHCPHCKYSIPWYLNIPLLTWLYLGGRCANCRAPISIRYFLVELLTALMFLGCWLLFGHQSAPLALVCCLILSGLTVATFIDFEHFIIPDEITIGGMAAGVLCSLLVPELHGMSSRFGSLRESILGMAAGAGVIYAIVRLGKLAFGRMKIQFSEPGKIVFTENALVLPDEEILYEDVFYRESDTIKLEASTAELSDRCYRNVTIRLTPSRLRINDEEFDPETVPHLEATTDEVVLPREAMGFGDVKFMAAIGAFLGWQSVVFALFASSVIVTVFSAFLLLLGKGSLKGRIPYGPYIALAAVIWVFGGHRLWPWFWHFAGYR